MPRGFRTCSYYVCTRGTRGACGSGGTWGAWRTCRTLALDQYPHEDDRRLPGNPAHWVETTQGGDIRRIALLPPRAQKLLSMLVTESLQGDVERQLQMSKDWLIVPKHSKVPPKSIRSVFIDPVRNIEHGPPRVRTAPPAHVDWSLVSDQLCCWCRSVVGVE